MPRIGSDFLKANLEADMKTPSPPIDIIRSKLLLDIFLCADSSSYTSTF